MADHLRRKAMAMVETVAGCGHGDRIAAQPRFNREPDGPARRAEDANDSSRMQDAMWHG
jgi:hypothetical protein